MGVFFFSFFFFLFFFRFVSYSLKETGPDAAFCSKLLGFDLGWLAFCVYVCVCVCVCVRVCFGRLKGYFFLFSFFFPPPLIRDLDCRGVSFVGRGGGVYLTAVDKVGTLRRRRRRMGGV